VQDVKSANVLLLDDGSVKLADFGLSVELEDEDERRNTITGTPHFMSPGNVMCLLCHYILYDMSCVLNS
jgi:serine/threonine protein kinase